MKKLAALFLAAMMLCGLAPVAQAAYPEKPITIVVPFAAGGETDIVARLVASKMSDALGQNVLVQNILGASGVTGISSVINSRPDGYTLGVTPSAPLALHPHMRKVPYTVDDFTFIGRIINAPQIMMVPKSSAWNTYEDMIKDMKANPEKYYWASAGVGSVPYFAIMDFMQTFDVPARHVPFTSDATAFQALAGDRAQVYASTAGVLEKFDVKPLLAFSPERMASLPNIPAAGEIGTSIFYSQWMPLLAPKGLPADVVAVLEDVLAKVCSSADFIADMDKLGLSPAYLNSADALAFTKSESARNADTVKRLMSN